MRVTLDKEDLITLVKGTAPYYMIQKSPFIYPYGTMLQERWEWEIPALKKCSEEQLWDIYKRCKTSWKEK